MRDTVAAAASAKSVPAVDDQVVRRRAGVSPVTFGRSRG